MVRLHFRTQEEKETIYKMLQDVMYIESIPFDITEESNCFIISPPTDLVPFIMESYRSIKYHFDTVA